MGTINRGAPTRLIKPALSINDVEPVLQARAKKLNGTRPHKTNNGKFLMSLFGMTFVQMNVRTPIMTRGLSIDQNTPRDMFRYRSRKSFRIRFLPRNQ